MSAATVLAAYKAELETLISAADISQRRELVELLALTNQAIAVSGGAGGGGDASEATLATRASESTVAAIEALLEGVLEVSADTLPLPDGAATNTTLQEVRDRLSKQNAHQFAPRLYVATTIATSGDNTIIAAPAAGTRIVITKIRIQGTSGTATSVLFKNGATVIARLRTTQDGSGLSEVYGFSDAIRLSAASAFILNLSAANAHSVSLEYYLESSSTGLPL